MIGNRYLGRLAILSAVTFATFHCPNTRIVSGGETGRASEPELDEQPIAKVVIDLSFSKSIRMEERRLMRPAVFYKEWLQEAQRREATIATKEEMDRLGEAFFPETGEAKPIDLEALEEILLPDSFEKMLQHRLLLEMASQGIPRWILDRARKPELASRFASQFDARKVPGEDPVE